MAEPKTTKTKASVRDFIAAIKDTEKQKDARALLRLMQRVAGEKPSMWGPSIVGFGDLHYHYASGRQGDWFYVGFSPRAANLTVYLMGGLKKLQPLLAKLGKHKVGGSCLYLGRFTDIDLAVLESVLAQAVLEARALEPTPRAAASAAKRGGTKAKRAVK
ncbi:MAG TPA: DUF1801 domain-containing protein [Polyangiaceae bacterium]|nr:DUF1801 domain-containing protein [Polyangiaceae bacterium]